MALCSYYIVWKQFRITRLYKFVREKLPNFMCFSKLLHQTALLFPLYWRHQRTTRKVLWQYIINMNPCTCLLSRFFLFFFSYPLPLFGKLRNVPCPSHPHLSWSSPACSTFPRLDDDSPVNNPFLSPVQLSSHYCSHSNVQFEPVNRHPTQQFPLARVKKHIIERLNNIPLGTLPVQ